MRDRIRGIFEESVRAKEEFLERNLDVLVDVVNALADTLKQGGKILLFGNGGSAADAQHIAAEFVNRFMIERPPLPAVALTTDTSVLTAIANDYHFDEIFSKQIAAIGKRGDAAIGISTSGTSANVIQGLRKASDMGILSIGFSGAEDTPMRACCDYYLSVDGASTPRIQETHALVGHTVVEMLDEILFVRDGR